MESDYTKITLENGLTVMLKEIHTAPLASVWMWYKVGSRHETQLSPEILTDLPIEHVIHPIAGGVLVDRADREV